MAKGFGFEAPYVSEVARGISTKLMNNWVDNTTLWAIGKLLMLKYLQEVEAVFILPKCTDFNDVEFRENFPGLCHVLLPSPTLTTTLKPPASPPNTFLIIRGKRINSHV